MELADTTTISSDLPLVQTPGLWDIIATFFAVWTIRIKATHDLISPVVELAALTVGGRSNVHQSLSMRHSKEAILKYRPMVEIFLVVLKIDSAQRISSSVPSIITR